MQSAFISYSTQNEAAVIPYEKRLIELGVNVWRDKSNLRQGQLSPMRLGEAIAEQEAVLLFWSANAAASHFVTLEWNTALALQKSIIPVLLVTMAGRSGGFVDECNISRSF
ncbi:MAG: toll/interleukin-1 receptor domain-containing protein [Thiolinea sp.]